MYRKIAAPDGVNIYVSNGEGSNRVSGFRTTSRGALSPIPGTPIATGGSGGFAQGGLVLIPGAQERLYVPNNGTNNVAAFSVGTGGALSPIPGSPFATGGMAPQLFSAAATVTNAGVAYRSGTSLIFRAHPGRSNDVTVSRGTPAASFVVFTDPAPRAITPAPSSGCLTNRNDQVVCSLASASRTTVALDDGDDRLNAQDGFPQTITCGTGFDSIFTDLQDSASTSCEVNSAAMVDVGAAARPVRRSARTRRGSARIRLSCGRGRQGGRCRGRLTLKRRGRTLGRARYRIRAGHRKTVRVPLTSRVRRRTKVRLLTRERARNGSPMTTRAIFILRP